MSKKELSGEGKDLSPDASNYDSSKYKKALNTVDVCICRVHEGQFQVLLIKRKYPPFANKWAISGGFVDIDNNEGLLEAAKRELVEETGVKDVKVRQLATYGDDPQRDPRDRTITTVYYALLNPVQVEKLEILAGDDAKETKWFDIQNLRNIAFDHKKILQDLHEEIRIGIQYRPFAFELAPENFTWTQLRNIYETILGKSVIAQNFPRDIKRIFEIENLNKFLSKGRGKPARIMRLVKTKKVF